MRGCESVRHTRVAKVLGVVGLLPLLLECRDGVRAVTAILLHKVAQSLKTVPDTEEAGSQLKVSTIAN